MSPEQLHILHHALGVRPDRREPFRNYYVAGPGHHSMSDLEALETDGMMCRAKTPAFCDQSDVVFVCTEAGRAHALEHLPSEPNRTKYDEYAHADCFESFDQFLGINKPKFEDRGYWPKREYRMFRRDLSISWAEYPDVTGDWKPTKKSAKASYKAALKAALKAARDAGRREKGFA